MPRLKLEFQYPADSNRSYEREIRRVWKTVDRALRQTKGEPEWASQETTEEWTDDLVGRTIRRETILCEVQDIEDRWSDIRDLLARWNLLGLVRVTVVGEDGEETDELWSRDDG